MNRNQQPVYQNHNFGAGQSDSTQTDHSQPPQGQLDLLDNLDTINIQPIPQLDILQGFGDVGMQPSAQIGSTLLGSNQNSAKNIMNSQGQSNPFG